MLIVTESAANDITQISLLIMIENFKKPLDKANKFGALLNDLSKAFDCINLNFPIVKIYREFNLYH